MVQYEGREASAIQAWRFWITRVLLCLATALIVLVTAYLCAWLSARKNYSRSEEHWKTRQDLERLRESIDLYKKTTGDWPKELENLQVVKEKQVGVDEQGHPVDGWGRRLDYRIQAGDYQLFSLGADGMPGGVGKYADLYAGQPDSWPEHPTLAQFSTLREARPVQLACILAGIVAFPLCLLQAKGQPGNRPSIAKVILANAVTAAFTLLIAFMISALHMMPGGH
jgi:hypothetical protein